MPEQININKPPQFIQPHMEKGLTAAYDIAKAPLSSTQLGAPTQATVDPFTQQAEQMAAGQLGLGAFTRDPTTGAGTDVAGAPGVAGYQKYLQGATGAVTAPTYSAQELVGPMGAGQLAAYESPYAGAVKQASLDEFDAQRQRDQNQMNYEALQSNAFGGGRHGVQGAQFLAQSNMDRNKIASQYDQQGYLDALRQRGADFSNLGDLAKQTQTQGLGSLSALGGLGTAGQTYGQAGIDTLATANRMQGMEPRERVGWYGNFLSQLMGGMPSNAGTSIMDAQGPMSPAMQAAQTGLGAGNIWGTLENIWNT